MEARLRNVFRNDLETRPVYNRIKIPKWLQASGESACKITLFIPQLVNRPMENLDASHLAAQTFQ